MALHADIEWELRFAGNNNNGGGFKIGSGGSDYCQQDAPELALTDVVANGTTTLTSVTGGFTAAMVGNIINVLTKGRFEITVRTDTNTITVDRTVSAGAGLTGNVGGAAATFEEIDSLIVPGNTIHVKNSGDDENTFTLAAAVDITDGTSTALVKILGYNSSRGDEPTGTDRPLIKCAGNELLFGSYHNTEHLRGTSDQVYGFQSYGHALFRNCYMITSGGFRCFRVGAYSLVIDCKAEGPGSLGLGFDFGGGSCSLIDSFSKGLSKGLDWTMGNNWIAHNTFKGNGGVTVGASCTNINGRDGMYFFNNNFYDCGNDGIYTSQIPLRWFIVNNNFKDCGDGIDVQASEGVWLDYNNFHGNTVDVKNCVKGPNTFAFDPQFVDAPNDDFDMGAAAQAFITRLGVG